VVMERMFETERISVMRVLVKIVLFQLRGHGHPQDDAMPNFLLDSKGPLLDLSNEVSFISEFVRKGG